MRLMIVVEATPDSEAGVMPTQTKLTEMARGRFRARGVSGAGTVA